MRIVFHGAAGEVTGSCLLVEAAGQRILVDCGMVQGSRGTAERNRAAFPFDPARLDAVVLTHAHIDHSGRLPLLVARGYAGEIHTHRATVDLSRIMLADSASLSEADSESGNRRRMRRGLQPVAPLYGLAEVEAAMQRFRGHEYHDVVEIAPGVELMLRDAGHILGSASVELRAGGRTLVVSGDLGTGSMPILRDPERVEHADLVVMESTYGDRDHRARTETVEEIGGLIEAAHRAGGSVLIPSFAVGRAQELLWWLARNAAAWRLDRWHVVLDSPMAQRVFEVYDRHVALFDEEARAQWRLHHPLRLPRVELVRDRAASAALNRREGLIVIAGAGMCTGGRILHHLKHRLWKASTHVLIVGYQAAGTLGRRLVDGAGYVRIHGAPVRVAAQVHTVNGLSAHAGQSGLLDWYAGFRGTPRVALVHGEARGREPLARALEQRHRVEALLPEPGDAVEL
jgi:metallo-beta-lactamase family protein